MKKNFSIFNPLTYDGAYILGLICSDGNLKDNSVEITRNKNAGRVLFHIARLIFGKEDVVREVGNEFVLTIADKEFAEYVRYSGGISSSRSLIFDLPSPVLWSFICGYFEGRAGEFKYDYQYPEIWIASHSHRLLEHIAAYWNVDYKGED
ncbi:hypothetical protein QUF72_23440 [Desulfobacterales bacterium HSG2]|nr:hypothetical protein [Desulfobacterales bacterium HSG2]